MTKQRRNDAGPRISIARRLDALDTEKTRGFATFIREGDDSPIPCWGAIADQFDAEFTDDDARMTVLDSLVEEGDRRALYLFVHLARSREKLLARMARRARKLPLSIQRALASLPEAEAVVEKSLKRFSPSAQAFYRGDREALAVENERFEYRIRELLAFRYYVPAPSDPREQLAQLQGGE